MFKHIIHTNSKHSKCGRKANLNTKSKTNIIYNYSIHQQKQFRSNAELFGCEYKGELEEIENIKLNGDFIEETHGEDVMDEYLK